MIGQNNFEAQTDNIANTVEESVTLKNRNDSTQVNNSQVDLHTKCFKK